MTTWHVHVAKSTQTLQPIDRKQVSVELPTSADNETLLAFAAERRAAAPLLVGARRPPPL